MEVLPSKKSWALASSCVILYTTNQQSPAAIDSIAGYFIDWSKSHQSFIMFIHCLYFLTIFDVFKLKYLSAVFTVPAMISLIAQSLEMSKILIIQHTPRRWGPWRWSFVKETSLNAWLAPGTSIKRALYKHIEWSSSYFLINCQNQGFWKKTVRFDYWRTLRQSE